jgi:hypothetical protein
MGSVCEKMCNKEEPQGQTKNNNPKPAPKNPTDAKTAQDNSNAISRKQPREENTILKAPLPPTPDPVDKMCVDDFQVHCWLGNGGFGRVGLVSFKEGPAKKYNDQTKYAMKIIKKKDLVQTSTYENAKTGKTRRNFISS